MRRRPAGEHRACQRRAGGRARGGAARPADSHRPAARAPAPLAHLLAQPRRLRPADLAELDAARGQPGRRDRVADTAAAVDRPAGQPRLRRRVAAAADLHAAGRCPCGQHAHAQGRGQLAGLPRGLHPRDGETAAAAAGGGSRRWRHPGGHRARRPVRACRRRAGRAARRLDGRCAARRRRAAGEPGAAGLRRIKRSAAIAADPSVCVHPATARDRRPSGLSHRRGLRHPAAAVRWRGSARIVARHRGGAR